MLVCPACGAAFLGAAETCPACAMGVLEAAEREVAPAELAVPFATGPEAVVAALSEWARVSWLRTAELDGAVLAKRLRPVWVPFWLVDVDVEGVWEAEVGFDYPVLSTQEKHANGTWVTVEVEETRIRWEPRVGTVRRRVDNVGVPGLGGQEALDARIGPPELASAGPVSGDEVLVRLADRSPAEQWPVARQRTRERVAELCREACGADHVREVFVDLVEDQAAWTWLLAPVWTTWYDDDEGRRHVVVVHGTTLRIDGRRMRSVRKGRMWAAVLAVPGVLCLGSGFPIGLVGVVLWPLLVLGVGLFVVGFILVVLALWPALAPGSENRKEMERPSAW